MVKHFSKRVGRDFYGAIYTPTLIDGWNPDFAEEFFEHENMAVAVTVSYFSPPHAAWGQHVVFVVVVTRIPARPPPAETVDSEREGDQPPQLSVLAH